MNYINFYENLTEAIARLRGTVVLYEGSPFHIWTITDHKGDGKFRVYMSPIEDVRSINCSPLNQVPHGYDQMGILMDQFMEANPNLRIERKMMNSPSFNRFRPFPLGMCNTGPVATYVERLPARPKMEQGLKGDMLQEVFLTAGGASTKPRRGVEIYSKTFRDCIIGEHPSPSTVLERLKSDKVENESVAFHRYFALVKGPIGSIFLAYKMDVVACLPNEDFSSVRLGKEFAHLKEVVQELNLFPSVGVR